MSNLTVLNKRCLEVLFASWFHCLSDGAVSRYKSKLNVLTNPSKLQEMTLCLVTGRVWMFPSEHSTLRQAEKKNH